MTSQFRFFVKSSLAQLQIRQILALQDHPTLLAKRQHLDVLIVQKIHRTSTDNLAYDMPMWLVEIASKQLL